MGHKQWGLPYCLLEDAGLHRRFQLGMVVHKCSWEGGPEDCRFEPIPRCIGDPRKKEMGGRG